MPLGYSFFEVFWRRKEKIRILKNISYEENKTYNFFHNLIFVSLGAAIIVCISHLIIYGEIKKDVYVLLLITIFSSFVIQSFVRKYLYIKYKYYKSNLGIIWGGFVSAFLFYSFIHLTIELSKIMSISLIQLIKSFLIEYFGLIIIVLFFFKKPIRSKKSSLYRS